MNTDSIDTRLRPVQVIIGALCLGLVTFGAVVAWLVKTGQVPAASGGTFEVLGYVAKGMLFAGVVAGWLFWRSGCTRAKSLAAGLSEGDARDSLLGLFQTGLIVRGALVEGPGLFCIVVALLTHDLLMLAWGGVAVAGLVAIFPTRGTYERFVRDAVGEAAGK